MKNFIISFTGTEGSSPIIEVLNNFPMIDIIGFEPFSKSTFRGGDDITPQDIAEIFNLIYKTSIKTDYANKKIQEIYAKYDTDEKIEFSKSCSIGFKHRFAQRREHIHEITPILKQHKVVTFFLFRRNILLKALSRYRGTLMYGKDKVSDLQFDVRDGKIDKDKLQKIKVDDFELLDSIIKSIEYANIFISKYMKRINENGVETYDIYYEDFCNEKLQFFRNILNALEIDISDEDISKTINKGCEFKKVHSNDIKSIVINHEEVMARYKHII